MARRETVQGLVLGRKPLGEADRMVVLLTRETGLRRVLAKGVRKIPSRRGGHLEPLTKVLAVLNAGRDYAYLAHVETVNYFQPLRETRPVFEQAQGVAQLASATLAEGEAQAAVFDYLDWAWGAAGELPFPKQALVCVAGTFLVLRAGGVQPNLRVCQRCGTREVSEAVVLSYEEGGWHCLSCHGRLWGATSSLPARLLPVLRYAAARPGDAWRLRVSLEEGQQLLAAMGAYTEAYVR